MCTQKMRSLSYIGAEKITFLPKPDRQTYRHTYRLTDISVYRVAKTRIYSYSRSIQYSFFYLDVPFVPDRSSKPVFGHDLGNRPVIVPTKLISRKIKILDKCNFPFLTVLTSYFIDMIKENRRVS